MPSPGKSIGSDPQWIPHLARFAAGPSGQFDNAGNMRLTTVPGGTVTTNAWDGENRLVQVAPPDGTVDTNVYNGDGLRVAIADSTGTRSIVLGRASLPTGDDDERGYKRGLYPRANVLWKPA